MVEFTLNVFAFSQQISLSVQLYTDGSTEGFSSILKCNGIFDLLDSLFPDGGGGH